MCPPHDLHVHFEAGRSKFFEFPCISYMYRDYRRLELHATPFTVSEIHTVGIRGEGVSMPGPNMHQWTY